MPSQSSTAAEALTIATLFIAGFCLILSCSKTPDPCEEFQTGDLKQSAGDTVLPYFAQGDSILNAYLISRFDYPKSALDEEIEGRILVRFTINADGSISNATILHGLQHDCDREALEVIAGMPDWHPATVNSIPVSMTAVMPFMLKIE